jgi:hypothetical protein
VKIPRYLEYNVLFHEDLVRRIDELARKNGESIESCIETVLRERFGFDGPKNEIYLPKP